MEHAYFKCLRNTKSMKNATTLTLAAALVAISAASAATVMVGVSTSPWTGFMNVFELPANGGGFVFGSGWGIGDLNTSFDDPGQTITFTPNTIGDPNEFWYQGGRPGEDPGNPNDNGGPGALGNKVMEANLFYTETGTLAGQSVTFQGMINSISLTGSHSFQVFIRDFAPDFSSSVDIFLPITEAGPFSISLDTINDPARNVQYGFQMRGENVWVTDVAPFGSVEISSAPIPEPSSALLGLVGLAFVARRRR